jgi:hypothetical protein
MIKLSLYKAKGYTGSQGTFAFKRFEVLIGANSFAEAVILAEEFGGPDGTIELVKDLDKEVIMEGEG